MGNKKARYKVGDTVVIKKYGTVGKITDINLPFLFAGQQLFQMNCQAGENKDGIGCDLFTFI